MGWLGVKVMSWVRAMYWMRSMWWELLSSWSMLSLAALWRWKCLLFGEPGSERQKEGRREGEGERDEAGLGCLTSSAVTHNLHQLLKSQGKIEPGAEEEAVCAEDEPDQWGGFTLGSIPTWKDQLLRH